MEARGRILSGRRSANGQQPSLMPYIFFKRNTSHWVRYLKLRKKVSGQPGELWQEAASDSSLDTICTLHLYYKNVSMGSGDFPSLQWVCQSLDLTSSLTSAAQILREDVFHFCRANAVIFLYFYFIPAICSVMANTCPWLIRWRFCKHNKSVNK